MNPKNKGLGRGLGAIFEIEGKDLPAKKSNHAFEEVEIASVVPNPKQPRTHFDEQALGELAESIRTLGVIQPLTVKKEDDGKYTIISGERRWRASQLAGLGDRCRSISAKRTTSTCSKCRSWKTSNARTSMRSRWR